MEQVLAELPVLYKVECRDFNLDAEDVSLLCTALAENSKRLTHVDVSRNRLDNDCACSLVEVLLSTQTCSAVRTIDLSWNRVDSAGAARICSGLKARESQIESLDLECNDLGDAGTKFLASALRFHWSLRLLNVAGNRIGKSGANCLAAALPESSLEHLNLSRNYIGAVGAESICAAVCERVPDTRHKDVTNTNRLRNSVLLSLKMSVNRLGDIGAKVVAAALAHAQVEYIRLSILDLANNMIGDDGAVELAKLLANFKTPLTSLVLSRNRIRHVGAEALLMAMENEHSTRLRTLELSGNEEISESYCVRVRIASRRNCWNIVAYDPLEATIAMCRCGCYDLDLTGVPLGPNAAKKIATAMSSGSARVLSLILRDTDLEDDAIGMLASACKGGFGVTRLDLSWNRLSSAGCDVLDAELLRFEDCLLVELNLECNNVGDIGAKIIANVIGFQASGKNDCRAGMQRLALGSNSIGPAGALSLAKAMQLENCKICWLDLSRNRIGLAAAAAFGLVLADPRSEFCSLVLSVNRLGDGGVQSLVSELSRTSTKSRSLKLFLRSNSISDEGADALARVIADGVPLSVLDLAFNKITGRGASNLAEAANAQKSAKGAVVDTITVLTEGNPTGVDGCFENNGKIG